MHPPKVYIARCPEYSSEALAAAMGRALATIRCPLGRHAVAKANWVFADARLARSCYTRPEVVRAALDVLLASSSQAHMTFIGNAGAGAPTAVMAGRARGEAAPFQRNGYWAFPALYPGRVRLEPTDEGRLARYTLSLGPRLSPEARHDYRIDPGPHARYWREIKSSAALAEADSLVFFPKLKTNVLSHGLTGACKLGGIGLLLDEDRMDGHNFHNDRRIADMLEIARPDLVITDGIDVAYGGNQMTESGRRLGIIIVADNPVAHDVVACHVLGLDARAVTHVRLAAERGWGPLDLAAIDLTTEVPLDELRETARGFGHHGGIDVTTFPEKYERETATPLPVEIISGPPYEHAGAQGVVLDWLYFSYDIPWRRTRMAAWPPMAFLVGEFDRLPTDPDAQVYVVGVRACHQFMQTVRVERRIDVPRFVRRVFGGISAWVRYTRPDGRRGWAVLIEGNPPTHRDLILAIAVGSRGRTLAPFFRLDLIFDSYVRMLGTQARRWWRNRRPPPVIAAADIARMRRYRPGASEST